MINYEHITLEEFWNKLISHGKEIHINKPGYEILDCNEYKILTYGNKYVNLVWISRHKTEKDMLEIIVKYKGGTNHVIVTTDHVCMIYNSDHFFENTNAKHLKINDYVSVYDEKTDTEYLGTIIDIKNLGKTPEWVYDLEVDDENHAFYANDILIHNSQFVNLQCISDYLRKTRNLPEHIRDWTDDDKRLLWDTVSEFVETSVNPFVRKLIHTYCRTTQQDVLTYELEYMGDIGIYQKKKFYAVHKIFSEGDFVDEVKYSGIELKKAQIPKQIKKFLADIYDGVLQKNWTNADYKTYICEVYDKFKQFSIDDISFWKGYGTERQASGFLEMETGTTGIAAACTYYNQILEKMKLGKKYDSIIVGDKVRFCYLDPHNDYGIKYIAYKPDQWPKEFNKIFKPDYRTMFTKLILDPLKSFRAATNFDDIDPSRQVQFDLFTL